MHGQEVFLGFFTETFFKGLDVLHEVHRLVVSDIVKPIGAVAGGGIRGVSAPVVVGFGDFGDDAVDAFHDIVDVGEISFHVAMVEYIDRPVFQNGLGEQEQSHVGAAPGAVYSKEPESRAMKIEQAAVRVGHEFVGFLAGGVQGDRVIHVVVD